MVPRKLWATVMETEDGRQARARQCLEGYWQKEAEKSEAERQRLTLRACKQGHAERPRGCRKWCARDATTNTPRVVACQMGSDRIIGSGRSAWVCSCESDGATHMGETGDASTAKGHGRVTLSGNRQKSQCQQAFSAHERTSGNNHAAGRRHDVRRQLAFVPFALKLTL